MKPRNPQPEAVIRVYTPESRLRRPTVLLGEMYRDLIASRELAWRLMSRDLKARYRRSVLGIIWAVLPVLGSTAFFVFLQRSETLRIPDVGMPYVIYVLAGNLLWGCFIAGLGTPIRAVGEGKALLKKIDFPREALILSDIGKVVFEFAIQVPVVMAVMLYLGISPNWTFLPGLLGMLMLLLLGCVFGFLLLPLSILYNDVMAGVNLLRPLWFLATPVVYPMSLVGEPFIYFVNWNPVAPLLTGSRLLLLGQIPDPSSGFYLMAAGLPCFALIGWVTYRIALPVLNERI